MKIVPADTVTANCKGDRSCPEPGCGARFAPTGKRRPTLVDANGRPYCTAHGEKNSPDYEKLLHTYAAARDAVAGAVENGRMSSDDAKYYYDLWDGPPIDA